MKLKFLLVAFFWGGFNIGDVFCQNLEYNYQMALAGPICNYELLKTMSNKDEVLLYEKEVLGLARPGSYIAVIDTAFSLTTGYEKSIIKVRLRGSNFCMTYYVNTKKLTCFLLRKGYEGEERMYLKGWNSFMKEEKKYFDSLSEERRESFFLDIFLPTKFCIIKKENQAYSQVQRFFSYNTVTDITQLYIPPFTKLSVNNAYYIYDDIYTKQIYFIRLVLAKDGYKIEAWRSEHFEPIGNDVLGYASHKIGPEVLFD